MDRFIKQISDKLSVLSLSKEEKENFLQSIFPIVQEQQKRIDFFHTRMLKDKNIAINLLNQAIDDLQVKQEQIQQVNQTLVKQKQLLETQSEQLRESLEKLEMSYEELEQFSYIASHDLRSPLRTIASYAQLLQRRYGNKLDQDGDEFLSFIVSGVKQMNSIISDLLDYSFIRDQKESFESIDFQEILGMVQFNLQSEIKESNALIEVGTLPDGLIASKSGMLQLFQNLIGNAIKFRGDRQPHIRISAQEENAQWQFTIADNGVGLDEQYANKVFLPFQRLEKNTLPGSGIGLAICKKIVKLHQGTIWYNSQPGEGTSFYFTISQEKLELC